MDVRFWAKTEKPNGADGCWLWRGTIAKKTGYGTIELPGKTWLAHRLSYHLTKGEIPSRMCVLHKCDVRNCINPAHLFLGTHQDNMDDMVKKGRQRAVRGELKNSAKLKEPEVLEIRSLFTGKRGNQAMLARKYGVTKNAIRALVQRQTWTHI